MPTVHQDEFAQADLSGLGSLQEAICAKLLMPDSGQFNALRVNNLMH